MSLAKISFDAAENVLSKDTYPTPAPINNGPGVSHVPEKGNCKAGSDKA
jgi:hypothetical protein